MIVSNVIRSCCEVNSTVVRILHVQHIYAVTVLITV